MNLWEQLTPDWQLALLDVQDALAQINQSLSQSLGKQAGKNSIGINPSPKLIFNALGDSPKDFRIVLVGQDPYPDAHLAMGLAFSIPSQTPNNKVPPSLRNIKQEFKNDLGLEIGNDLTAWRESGVLLLNRILTCETGKSLSHKDLGWQEITTKIIEAVVKANPDTVAILWGNYAAQVEHLFKPELIIKSAHPSPLSANRLSKQGGFFGSKPFSKANQMLIDTDQLTVNWA